MGSGAVCLYRDGEGQLEICATADMLAKERQTAYYGSFTSGGIDALPGNSVREKQLFLERHADGLRRLLLSEPYGDPAMSVNLVVPPHDPRAQAGYIIMEAMGYPMYSGSNTICTATAVMILLSGVLEPGNGVTGTQLTQAAIIKREHPTLPVFVYAEFGGALGFDVEGDDEED